MARIVGAVREPSKGSFSRDNGKPERYPPHLSKERLSNELEALNREIDMLKPFEYQDQAELWLHDNAHSLAVASGFEVGANIFRDGSRWMVGNVVTNFDAGFVDIMRSGMGDRGWSWKSTWHSHGGYLSKGWWSLDQAALDRLNVNRSPKISGRVSFFDGENHVLSERMK